MSKAILQWDEDLGFILVDEERNFVGKVDAGDIDGDIDWDLVSKQAEDLGYNLVDSFLA